MIKIALKNGCIVKWKKSDGQIISMMESAL